MIDFRVAGESLELPTNLVLSITRNSPVYFGGNLDVIPGTFTLPVTISGASSTNRRILGHRHLLNRWVVLDEGSEVELWLNGNLFDRGVIYYKTLNSQDYKIQFVSAAGALQQLKERTLNDYDWGDNVIVPSPQPQGWETLIQQLKDGNFNYVMFPFYHYDESRVNDWEKYGMISFFVWRLIRKIVETEGYRYQGGVFNVGELAELILANNRRIDMNYNPIFNQSFLPASMIPKVVVTDFLKGLQKNFAVAFEFDTYRNKFRSYTYSSLLDSSKIDDWTELLTSKVTKLDVGTLVSRFEYPRQSQLDELNEIGERILDYDIQDAVQSENDLSGSDGTVRFVHDLGAFVRRRNGNWQIDKAFDALPDFEVTLKDGATVSSNLGTAFMYRHPSHQTVNPAFAGDMIEYDSNFNGESARDGVLLYFRGEQVAGTGNNYVLASNQNYDINGNRLGENTLRWFGEDGLYNRHWSRWVDFLRNSQPVQCDIVPTWKMLYNFDWQAKIRMWDDDAGGYHHFFCKQLKIIVGQEGLLRATQQLVQIR